MSKLKNCSKTSDTVLRAGNSIVKTSGILVISILLFNACGPSKEEMEKREGLMARSMAIADSVSSYASVKTDTVDGVPHTFIRTADLKFKVHNVIKTSKEIEDLIRMLDGYVSLNDLSSNVELINSVKFKADSVKEIKRYTTSNFITLKIPNRNLDSALRKIAGMALFIDMSRLKAEDVKMKLYANMLAEHRYARFQKRLIQKSEQAPSKLKQNAEAEEKLLEKQELSDNRSVDSYALADQVNFSTIRLEVYQSPAILCETLALPPAVPPYEPSFGERLLTGLQKGFLLITNFVLLLVESWGLIVILLALFMGAKKVIRIYNQKSAIASRQN